MFNFAPGSLQREPGTPLRKDIAFTFIETPKPLLIKDYKQVAQYHRSAFLWSLFLVLCLICLPVKRAHSQRSTAEVYSAYQNRLNVADTLTERLLSQRQAIRAGY